MKKDKRYGFDKGLFYFRMNKKQCFYISIRGEHYIRGFVLIPTILFRRYEGVLRKGYCYDITFSFLNRNISFEIL
jgi:hypothetical protein